LVYSIPSNSDDYILASLLATNPLSKKSWWQLHALEYRIIRERYVSGMLLHINGKFTRVKLKSLLRYLIIETKKERHSCI